MLLDTPLVRLAACCALQAAEPGGLSLAEAQLQPGLRSPTVDYDLEVTLDQQAHALTAHGAITLHNTSSVAVPVLYLHLYLNAFASPSSVFFRSDAQARTGERPTRWANVTVTHFGYAGSQRNLWPQAPHSPGDPEDATDIRVELPQAVAAGQSARFEVAWTAQLPTLVERTGFEDEFHFLGQWFPKLAKLEPDGTWAHFTFHPHSEFYANFGNYTVTLDVDRQLVVGASGALESEQLLGDRKRLVYRAQAVHDFAWTAWPGFETLHSEFDGVRIHRLFPPGFERNAELSLRAVEHGLRYYGERYGRYPYRDLSVVMPPDWAGAAGGMEYPGLITLNGPWYAGWLSNAIEQVALHELGHQWFYGLLASNESQWPFMDEGFTSFVEARALHALLGPGNGVALPGMDISASAYYRFWGNDTSLPIAQPAREFPSFYEIGKLAYSRTATLLETLSRSVPGFDRVLEDYVKKARFTHPTPNDLLAAIEQGLGADVRQQFERALFARGAIDFSVQSLSSTPRADGGHDIAVHVSRTGELQFPVEIALRHADGSVIVRRWDGQSAELRLDYYNHSALQSVLIDPELRVPLDGDLSNNAALLVPAPPSRWQRRALHWLTLLLRSVLP